MLAGFRNTTPRKCQPRRSLQHSCPGAEPAGRSLASQWHGQNKLQCVPPDTPSSSTRTSRRYPDPAQHTSPSAIVPSACARGAVQQRQRRRRPRQCVRPAVATTAPLSRTPQNTVAAAIEDTSKAAVGTLRGGNRAELEETSWKRVHQKYRQKGGRSQGESYHKKQQEPFIASIIYLEKWPERDCPSVLPLVSFRRP